jgi:predicted O-methyltransferase YrrM
MAPPGGVGSVRLGSRLAMPGDFANALTEARRTEGWLTDGQAMRLWERAREVADGGRIVEIGSFRGRSAIILARAAAPGVELFAIDPHAGNDRGPQELAADARRGDADRAAFRRNLEHAGVADRVQHVRLRSQDALGTVPPTVDLLYVDGAHRYRPALADLRHWGARVRTGGVLLVHDAFSSVGVSLAIGRTLLAGRDFAYEGRVGTLAQYRRRPLAPGARVSNAARQLAETPFLARNLALKLLIMLGLRRVMRALGRSEPEWPY